MRRLFFVQKFRQAVKIELQELENEESSYIKREK